MTSHEDRAAIVELTVSLSAYESAFGDGWEEVRLRSSPFALPKETDNPLIIRSRQK
jgi:hypothetical protein